MTVEEAIEKLEFLNEALNFQRHDADECSCALQMGIDAIKEVQQYRAIGTVKGYERAIQISIENYNLCREYKAKVQEFEAIGTVSEFRELKEKATAKKPIHNGHGVYFCPKCHGTVWQIPSESHYCFRCGTAFDWNKGKE